MKEFVLLCRFFWKNDNFNQYFSNLKGLNKSKTSSRLDFQHLLKNPLAQSLLGILVLLLINFMSFSISFARIELNSQHPLPFVSQQLSLYSSLLLILLAMGFVFVGCGLSQTFFYNTENAQLLTWPLPMARLLLARLLTFLCRNSFLFAAILPGFFVAQAMAFRPAPLFYLLSLLSLLILPLFFVTLFTLIYLLLQNLFRWLARIPSRGTMDTISIVLGFGCYLAYTALASVELDFFQQVGNFPLLKQYAQTMLLSVSGEFSPAFLIVLLAAIVLLLVLLLITHFSYKKIMQAAEMKSGGKKRKLSSKDLQSLDQSRSTNLLSYLFKREVSSLLHFPSLLFSAFLMTALSIVATVLLLLNGPEVEEVALVMILIPDALSYLLMAILPILGYLGLTNVGLFLFSKEGEAMSQLKTMPVAGYQWFLSKHLLCLLLSLPLSIPLGLVFFLFLEPLVALLLLLVVLLTLFFTSTFTLLLDMRHPFLSWTMPSQVGRGKGLRPLYAFICLLLLAGLTYGLFLLVANFWLLACFVLLMLTLANVFLFHHCLTRADAYLRKMSV